MNTPSHYLLAMFKLAGMLRKLSADRIISCSTNVNVVAILASLMSGYTKRLMITEHGLIALNLKRRNWTSNALRRLLVMVLYRLPKRIVAVSDGARDSLCDFTMLSKERVLRIYNPIDIESILQLSSQFPSHPWFVKGGPPIVLGVGRISKEKNFLFLAKAFAHLRKKMECRLVILGDGDCMQLLQDEISALGISEDVVLLGKVSNPYQYMTKANVFALSSDHEAFGNVLVEAMVCGLPIVARSCPGGVREVLRNGEFGVLVPMDEPDAFAEAMFEVLSGKVTFLPAHLRARAQDFASSTIADTYLGYL